MPRRGEEGRSHEDETSEGEEEGPPPAAALRAESASEGVAVRVTPRRIASERPGEHALEPRRDGGALARARDGPRVHERHELDEALGLEEAPTREALVEDRSEGEDVGLRPHGAGVPELLRGHVAGGPAQGAVLRERDALARAGGAVVEVLRDPEVGDEGSSLGREDDVLRLEVAVDDPALVGPAERGREALGERERLVERETSPAQARPERAAREVRHDDEAARSRRARVEERDEALGLSQAPEEAPLPVEPGGRVSAARGEDLDRHVATLGRAGAVDDAYPASSDLSLYLVAADPHGPPGIRAEPANRGWPSGPRRA